MTTAYLVSPRRRFITGFRVSERKLIYVSGGLY
jgi:hypothetical protein